MLIHRSLIPALMCALGLCALPAAAADLCPATDITATLPYSGTGCFNTDDVEQSFVFTLGSSQTVNMYTTSFAGGGFAPVLTLFTGGDNSFIASDDGGVYSNDPEFNTCGARGVGTADGATTCLDAYLTRNLGPGSYRLVLT